MSNSITQDDIQRLEQLSLPKWPQMLVWGERVSLNQAKDIIFRTDGFLTAISRHRGGNNHRWNDWARSVLGYADLIRDDNYALSSRVQEHLRHHIRFVATEYVHNTWASSSYIYGPYGWCHPDGRIWFEDNIGKWPSVREVFEEWQALAAAFNYLDLTVTLMSGESCEDDTAPVVSFRVRRGEVAIMETPVLPPAEHRAGRNLDDALPHLLNPSREQGLPDDWIGEYSVITWSVLPEATEKALSELSRGVFAELSQPGAATST